MTKEEKEKREEEKEEEEESELVEELEEEQEIEIKPEDFKFSDRPVQDSGAPSLERSGSVQETPVRLEVAAQEASIDSGKDPKDLYESSANKDYQDEEQKYTQGSPQMTSNAQRLDTNNLTISQEPKMQEVNFHNPEASEREKGYDIEAQRFDVDMTKATRSKDEYDIGH